MHAVLRSLDAQDLYPETLDTYAPTNPDDFGTLVTALIGPSNGPGEEVFYVTVCTPAWLADNVLTGPSKGFEFVRHKLVMQVWDAGHVRRAISDLCTRSTGTDWSETANKVGRFLAWEFEDYTP